MVYHVLKDGSRVSDISGHVVKVSDAEPLYTYINAINNVGSKRVSTYEITRVNKWARF